MDIFLVLQLFGGIGLFLFGMSLMGTYLKELAGSSLEQILERLTTGRSRNAGYLKGWGLGTAVTAIIQSSAATTIMLIGFVNAGIMRLAQAVPVMMGANVGSTVTAQLLRLGDLGNGSVALRLLKPASFAPILVGMGAFVFLFVSKKKWKDIAGILVGLGLLFYGMTAMEQAFAPLKELPSFQRLFTSFNNPAAGVLCGLLVTAVLQSSSASVGILQALSATGVVTYATAIPIIIGQNIGKCATILIGSIGTGKKSRRLAVSYLLFNLIGAAVSLFAVYGIYYTVGLPWFSKTVNRGIIANLHLLFNLGTSLLMLPFTEKLIALTGVIVGREKPDPADLEFAKLDDLLLRTPSVALRQCWELTRKMEERCRENYRIANAMLAGFDPQRFAALEENERFIDRCETALSAYIIRLDRKRLTREQKLTVGELLNSITDFERIGDYSINIAYVLREMGQSGTEFSHAGDYEIGTISSAVAYLLEILEKAFTTQNPALADRLEPLTDMVSDLKDLIRENHIRRLTEGACSVQAGVDLNDLLNCYERIASHGLNVAMQIVSRGSEREGFDQMHGHVLERDSDEYRSLYQYYEAQYIQPLLFMNRLEEREKGESRERPQEGAQMFAAAVS